MDLAKVLLKVARKVFHILFKNLSALISCLVVTSLPKKKKKILVMALFMIRERKEKKEVCF